MLPGGRDWYLSTGGGTGSCHSDGQGHVKGCVYWQLLAQDDFRQPVC